MFDVENPVHTRIGYAVETYFGTSWETLDVIADPEVIGVYAVRATGYPGDEEDGLATFDFLVNLANWHTAKAHGAHPLDWESLEETDFTSWPPTSGNLHF